MLSTVIRAQAKHYIRLLKEDCLFKKTDKQENQILLSQIVLAIENLEEKMRLFHE